MRKIISLLGLLLLSESNMLADNYVVGSVTIPQGGTATLEIGLNNSTNECGGFEFVLATADGITVSAPVRSSRVGEEFSLDGSSSADGFKILAYNISKSVISGTSGTIVSVTLTADAGLTVGTTLDGQLNSAYISNRDGDSFSMDDVDFTITIGEPADSRTLLDENSSTAPEANAGPVDVRVKRTIAAGNWSTICLPFAMTEAQAKEAFGNDVQLADFTGVDSEFDADDKVVGITANFSNVTTISANHPYIIKVTSPITEFTMDGVTIAPDEDDAIVEFDNGKTGSRRVVYSGLYGTYHSGTVVPKNCLFLSNNKFWYSAGLTTMKGYRAFFEFLDILSEVEEAEVKMFINVDGEETRIEGLSSAETEEAVYDLNGRKVSKPQLHGVYIVNGKKIVK